MNSGSGAGRSEARNSGLRTKATLRVKACFSFMVFSFSLLDRGSEGRVLGGRWQGAGRWGDNGGVGCRSLCAYRLSISFLSEAGQFVISISLLFTEARDVPRRSFM